MERGDLHVCVIGAGITGLSFAFYLEKLAKSHHLPLRISLLEQSDRIGGKLQTYRDGPFLIEEGAESLHMQKPAIRNLLQELGAEDELISPLQREFYLLHKEQLHRMNPELFRPYPHNIPAAWNSSFLSSAAKLRVALAPVFCWLKQTQQDSRKKSIAECLQARWGKEFSKTVLEPLYAGIHAGNAEQLSMKALYPHMDGAASDPKLSSAISMFHKDKKTSVSQPPFQSLRNGLGSLAPAILGKLNKTTLHLQSKIEQISTDDKENSVRIRVSGGDELTADYALLCIPSYAAAKILPQASESLRTSLSSISFSSSAIVTLGYKRSQVQKMYPGTGFISSNSNQSLLTACTWSSEKWEGRADSEHFLLRGYLGNACMKEDALNISDKQLVEATIQRLKPLMHLHGAPILTEVHRWKEALPQYDLGHLERVNEIKQGLQKLPGIALAGASYRGLGVPDCIRQGQEAARLTVEQLQRRLENGKTPADIHSSAA